MGKGKFEIGNKVKVISKNSKYYNHIGTIRDKDYVNGDDYCYDIGVEDEWFLDEELENVEDKTFRYVAQITQGDKYHKAGETYFLLNSEVEEVKERGYRIYEKDCGPDGAQIFYPCKVIRREYKLVSEDEIGTSKIQTIKTEFCEDNDPNWWINHWC